MYEIKRLLGYGTALKRYFGIIIASSVLLAGLSLATPYIMKFATDWVVSITAGKEIFSWSTLILLVGMQLTVALLSVIIGDVGGWYGDMMAVKLRHQLSTTYYEHLLTLPQKYYDGEVTGKVINRLSRAITDISNFLQFFSNNLLQMLITMVITVIVLFAYSWPLAVLFLLLIPANLALTAKTSKRWQKLEAKKNTHFDIASGRFAEVIAQMRLVKSFGSQKRELKSFDTRINKMVGLTREQSAYWHRMNALRGVVFGIIFATIYGIIFYQTANRSISVGDMVLLVTLVQQVAFPLRNISFFVDSYQRAVANSKDFVIAMNEIPEVNDAATQALTISKGRVEYRDITFAYDDSKEVLSNVSFAIEPGQKVALVGESGSGKTTLSNLLMRLYEPTSGQVLVDEQNIVEVTQKSIRTAVATVFQEATLFSGTIRENIAYALPSASDEQIVRAAKAANAFEFIQELQNGFDTEIGERGIKLSGGQRQRIAIARALLKDAPILILDEATSSLDSRSEAEVQDALDRLMKGRSVLIIAHRLSTIAHVDQIVTMSHGKVDEIGAPAELAKTGGIYSQLLELQLGSTKKARERLKEFEISA